MIVQDIKPLVKGTAKLESVLSGGIAVYHIYAEDGTEYQLSIDTSDKKDVGESACFNLEEKGMLLMRWIKRGNESNDGSLIKLN